MRGLALLLVALASGCSGLKTRDTRPPEIVSLADIDPTIWQELRYHTGNNFMGRPLPGYTVPKCYLTKPAAEALKRAHRELRSISMGLKVYDCYRPHRAVREMVKWAGDVEDTRMREQYYPRVEKAQLIPQGYIAEKSGHSRGSTVDLTLVDRKGVEVDMGTSYDFFDPSAHTDFPNLTQEQRAARVVLRGVLQRVGFRNLPEEWWHFTYVNEPFKEEYFDFPIE